MGVSVGGEASGVSVEEGGWAGRSAMGGSLPSKHAIVVHRQGLPLQSVRTAFSFSRQILTSGRNSEILIAFSMSKALNSMRKGWSSGLIQRGGSAIRVWFARPPGLPPNLILAPTWALVSSPCLVATT